MDLTVNWSEHTQRCLNSELMFWNKIQTAQCELTSFEMEYTVTSCILSSYILCKNHIIFMVNQLTRAGVYRSLNPIRFSVQIKRILLNQFADLLLSFQYRIYANLLYFTTSYYEIQRSMTPAPSKPSAITSSPPLTVCRLLKGASPF